MQEIRSISIRKEALKFASSHMTVFANGTKEAIHGHQYIPTVRVFFYPGHKMIPFSDIKTAMKKISSKFDEKLLLAGKNSYLKNLKKVKKSLKFVLCNKFYELPIDEVVILPIENITCEELSAYYADELIRLLPWLKKMHSFAVSIEESPGQSAETLRIYSGNFFK